MPLFMTNPTPFTLRRHDNAFLRRRPRLLIIRANYVEFRSDWPRAAGGCQPRRPCFQSHGHAQPVFEQYRRALTQTLVYISVTTPPEDFGNFYQEES